MAFQEGNCEQCGKPEPSGLATCEDCNDKLCNTCAIPEWDNPGWGIRSQCPACDGEGVVAISHYLRVEAQGDFGNRPCALCQIDAKKYPLTAPVINGTSDFLIMLDYIQASEKPKSAGGE